jgi:ribosomal 30S subunit maturation factor RimM
MVKAKIGLDDYSLLMVAGPLVTADGRSFKVEKWQGAGQGMVALQIEGITTVEAAELLKGVAVLLDRSKWPEDEDEVYLDSLIGTEVLGPDGAVVATVKAVVELPAGPALEVEMDGKTKVLPCDEEFVELGEQARLTELGMAVLAV